MKNNNLFIIILIILLNINSQLMAGITEVIGGEQVTSATNKDQIRAPSKSSKKVGSKPCIDPFSTIHWPTFFDEFEIGTYGHGSKSSNPVCMCNADAGVKMKITEPVKFSSTIDTPLFFPCFQDESSASIAKQKNRGLGISSDSEEGVRRNEHIIMYPVFAILNLFFEDMCVSEGDIDIGFIGELDPQWLSEYFSTLSKPETFLVNNPLGQLSCLADCVKSSTGYPIDSMSWCAGCWGGLSAGNASSRGNEEITESALYTVKALDFMHFRNQMKQTLVVNGKIAFSDAKLSSGEDVACKPKYFPKIIKSQYLMNMAYPNPNKAFEIGEWPTKINNFMRVPTYPSKIKTIWQRHSCCFGVVKKAAKILSK